MEISTEHLISMLMPNPINDKEIGFNSAIISILQLQTVPTENLNGRKRIEIYREKLKGYNLFTLNQIREFDEYLINDVKLSAVKLHKEVAGFGLKESKENVDELFALIKNLK